MGKGIGTKMKKEKRKKDSDIRVIYRLFQLFARNNKSTIQLGVATALLEGVQPYILIVLSGMLIDGLAAGLPFQTLLKYVAIGLGIELVIGVIDSYLRQSFNAKLENCMERQNRDLNEQGMKIDYEYLEDQSIQEKKRKQEQTTNAKGGVYWMIIWPLDRGLKGLIQTITALVVAIPLFRSMGQGVGEGFWASPWTTVLLFLTLATCVGVNFVLENWVSKKTKVTVDKYAECNKVSNYILHNILSSSESAKDVRIFAQDKLVQKVVHGGEEAGRKYLKLGRKYYMGVTAISRTLSNAYTAFVYIYAAMKAYLGYISIGSVVLYASSIIKCVDGIQEMFWGISGWKRAAQYGRDYLDYVEFEDKKYRGTIPVEKRKDDRFLVEFDHVSFKYPGSDIYVIKDLSLKLDIGERLAIVGKNGSGKTTFIKLLCRLYDVTEGCIKVNNVDIRNYNTEEYLKLFSVVFQDYRMFALKLGENLAASEQVDETRAKDALQRAGLWERFEKLEQGYDTYVGKEYEEDGVNVSGGEKQKLAIARSIYKGAPFVIMDEPTAALDPVAECEVFAGFDEMVGRKTAIYISHRLASCRFCHDILVFDKGQVVQRGNHEELVEQDGLYQKLWNAQAQYYA